jgi:hypothetical protein
MLPQEKDLKNTTF